MPQSVRFLRRGWAGFLLAVLGGVTVYADGLPEPSVILYGVVTDDLGKRLTQGQFTLTLTPDAAGNSPVAVTVTLSNLNDQYSYAASFPAEAALANRARTPGRLTLGASAETWRLSPPRLGATALNILPSARATLSVSRASRGALVRTDLSRGVDTDGNGLIDAWERLHFGRLGVDPLASAAGDGVSNLTKMFAGLDPHIPLNTPLSFTTVQTNPDGSFHVEWSSETGKSYRLWRATALAGPYSVIQTGILGTPPANTFNDPQAKSAPAFFYRVEKLP